MFGLAILAGSGGLGYFAKRTCCNLFKLEKIAVASVCVKVWLTVRLTDSYINILLYISNSGILVSIIDSLALILGWFCQAFAVPAQKY